MRGAKRAKGTRPLCSRLPSSIWKRTRRSTPRPLRAVSAHSLPTHSRPSSRRCTRVRHTLRPNQGLACCGYTRLLRIHTCPLLPHRTPRADKLELPSLCSNSSLCAVRLWYRTQVAAPEGRSRCVGRRVDETALGWCGGRDTQLLPCTGAVLADHGGRDIWRAARAGESRGYGSSHGDGSLLERRPKTADLLCGKPGRLAAMDRRPPQPQPLALPAAEPLPHAPCVARRSQQPGLQQLWRASHSHARDMPYMSIARRSWRQLQSIRRRVCLPMAPGGKRQAVAVKLQ